MRSTNFIPFTFVLTVYQWGDVYSVEGKMTPQSPYINGYGLRVKIRNCLFLTLVFLKNDRKNFVLPVLHGEGVVYRRKYDLIT